MSDSGHDGYRRDRGMWRPQPAAELRPLVNDEPVPFGASAGVYGPVVPWLTRTVERLLPRFLPALALAAVPLAVYIFLWRLDVIPRGRGGIVALLIYLVATSVGGAAAAHLVLAGHLGLASPPGRSLRRVLTRLPRVALTVMPLLGVAIVGGAVLSDILSSTQGPVDRLLSYLVVIGCVAGVGALAVRCLFAVMSAVAGPRGSNPYRHSWHLTAGRFRPLGIRLLLLVVAVAVIQSVVGAVVSQFQFATVGFLPLEVWAMVFDLLGAAVQSVGIILVFSATAELFLASGGQGEL